MTVHRTSGFSLLEAAICITIIALLAGTLIPLATKLVDTQRANAESDELQAAYKAIVGDPNAKTFGYLGDVGDYPSQLLDLVQSPGLTGWNGPYINAARIDSGIVYDPFGGKLEYYQPTPAACTTGTCPSVPDQLALISK